MQTLLTYLLRFFSFNFENYIVIFLIILEVAKRLKIDSMVFYLLNIYVAVIHYFEDGLSHKRHI